MAHSFTLPQIARDFGIHVETRGGRGGGGGGQKRQVVALSRDEAMRNAKSAAEVAILPMVLSNGVTVKSFGTVKPEYVSETLLPMVGYTAEWTDQHGVRFVSTIKDLEFGPYYVVSIAVAEGQASVEVGSGLLPDAAWQAATERQAELLGNGNQGGDRRSVVKDEVELRDELLQNAAPLAGCWGLERFGLADIQCLAALEGQSGVENTVYKYVGERSTWEEERKWLQLEGKAHSKHRKQLKLRRGARSVEERDKMVVERVIDRMIRQIEAVEARNAAGRQRARSRNEGDVASLMLQKEQLRMAKERKKEVTKMLNEQHRDAQRVATTEAMRLAAEAARTYEDATLDSASVPPPKAERLLAGRLSFAAETVLLECWHLLNHFSDLLEIDASQIPSIPALEASLSEPMSPSSPSQDHTHQPSPVVWVLCALVRFLVNDLFQRAAHHIAEENDDVREVDLRPPGKSSPPIPVDPDTWQEAARRYLATMADAAAVWARERVGHLPISLPMAALDPFLVLQYLTAGPPIELGRGIGGLPEAACDHAWHGIQDRDHAAAHSAALSALYQPPPDVETIQLQRCLMQQLCNIKGERGRHSRLLYWHGLSAAAAQRSGLPLDLRTIAARVDAGIYARSADPLDALTSDITYAVNLHQSAAAKASSAFAAEYADKGVAEVGAMILSKLERLLDIIKAKGAQGFIEENRVPPPIDGNDTNQRSSDAVMDLRHPFCPSDACLGCWDDKDPVRLVQCSDCGIKMHLYCLETPPSVLEAPPDGEGWRCSHCSIAPEPVTAVFFAKGSEGETIWKAAEHLRDQNWASWAPAERVALLRILCALVAESPALRERLMKEEEDQKNMRKELQTKRNELKQRQQMLAEETGKADEPESNAAVDGTAAATGLPAKPHDNRAENRPLSRAARELGTECESLIEQISRLEHDIEQFKPARLEPLGLDRHWNKYWLLPAAALGKEGASAIVVEYASKDGEALTSENNSNGAKSRESPRVALYYGPKLVAELISWLNPRGVREQALQNELRKARLDMQTATQKLQREKEAKAALAGVDNGEAAPGIPASVQQKVIGPHDAVGDVKPTVIGPPVERLRAAILDFESGLLPASRHPIWGTEPAMESWRAKVKAASSPQDFMAMVLILEQSITPAYLRVHWRSWAAPAPHPAYCGNLSSVWMRFEALRGATKLKVALGRGARDLLQSLPMRPKREVPKASDESGAMARRRKRRELPEDSAGNASGQEARGARAAKRSHDVFAEPSEIDDEAYARRLHAELNAQEDMIGRQSRLRAGTSAREEARSQYRSSLRGPSKLKSYKESSDDEDAMEWDEMEESQDPDDSSANDKEYKEGEAQGENDLADD